MNTTITLTSVNAVSDDDDGMGTELAGILIGFLICFVVLTIVGFIYSNRLKYNRGCLPKASDLSMQLLHSPSPSRYGLSSPQLTYPVNQFTQPVSPLVPLHLQSTAEPLHVQRSYSPTKTPQHPSYSQRAFID